RFVRGEDRVTDIQTFRRENVALLAIRISNERQVRRTIRIVLEGLHLGGHVEDVAMEIDDAVKLFVTAAAMTRGDATVDIAAAGLVLVLGERALRALFREALLHVQRGEPA